MLAILTSHPIQYQVPLWRALADTTDVPFQVWYLTNHGVTESRDAGFGRTFAWDLDMLSGYSHQFLEIEPNWSLERFRGVRLRESLAERLKCTGARALWVEGWRLQANWQAMRAAQAAGVRIWLRGESNDLKRDARWKSLVKRPLLKRYFNRVDKFLYIGSANRRLYESYGVPQGNFASAPYCVDNDRFADQADELRRERDAIRQAWRIPDDSYCVLFCGKFVPKKRPVDLVRAVRRLTTASAGPAIHLLFVGSGELGAELRHACRAAYDVDGAPSVDDNSIDRPVASFVGFMNQTEVAKAYVAADLLVLPSDFGETWGLVANEAMACGTPAVVSDECGCAEDLIAPLDRRFVFRCGDVGGLAVAIREAKNAAVSQKRVLQIVDTHHLRHTVETVQRLYAANG